MDAATLNSAMADPTTDVRLTVHRATRQIGGNCIELSTADGHRILYSGDFRIHGRKSALTRKLMAMPPENLDVLLMEGTNLGSDKSCVTESDLEDTFVDLFQSTAGRVFVAWSAQNVDRTVTL